MTLPATINVSLDFSNGPVYGIAFTIGDPSNGILGVNVLADAASDVVDLSSQTVKVDIQRGRNILADRFEVGNCTVRVIDTDGAFNPQNVDSPYYGKLQPLRKLRISATVTATGQTYYLFSGYTSAYKYTFPTGQELGYVDIVCQDAFRLFNMAGVSDVAGSNAGDYTGQRVGQILNTVSWPNSMRSIETGLTTCIDDPSTQRSVLSALQTVENSEYGALFIDPAGDVVFYDRDTTIAMAGGTPVEFAQDSSGINYASVAYAFDDKQVVNNVTATRYGGTKQSHTDTESINQYFIHTINYPDLVCETDADALNIAKAYVASHKDTSIRIDSLSLDLNYTDYTDGVTAALSLDYFDPVKITNTTATGSTIVKQLQVMGVKHAITPRTWVTTLTTQEPIIDGFIIGSNLYGIIGQSVLSY
jgi:hypothetical protein